MDRDGNNDDVVSPRRVVLVVGVGVGPELLVVGRTESERPVPWGWFRCLFGWPESARALSAVGFGCNFSVLIENVGGGVCMLIRYPISTNPTSSPLLLLGSLNLTAILQRSRMPYDLAKLFLMKDLFCIVNRAVFS